MLGHLWSPTMKFLAFWLLASSPTSLFWGLLILLKPVFKFSLSKMSNPPPDYFSDWFRSRCIMTSWLKTVICIGCGNGSTHTVLFTFHPSKINQYKWLIGDHHMLGLWKWSKLCTLALLSHLSLIKNYISISHWLTTITVFDSHAGILLQTVMFHLSLMVNKSVLACQGLI